MGWSKMNLEKGERSRMKRYLLILAIGCSIVMFAGDFSGWQCIESCFETGTTLMIDSREPMEGSICRSPLCKVEPGADYILTFLADNKLSAGEVTLELKCFSGYDGTEESIRKMKLLSTMDGAPMKGGQSLGLRTWRCAFTAPSDVTVFQARLNAKDCVGSLTLRDWSLGPGDTALALPLLQELPPMDGTLPPAFAEQALCLPDFLVFPEKEEMQLETERTEAYLAASQTHVMAIFVMHLGKGQQWVTHEHPRDGEQIWRDDSMEIYITHVGGSRPLYLMMANLRGDIYDSMNENITWNSHLEVKVGAPDKKTRVIQMRFPLEDIGYVPYVDDRVVDPLWRINIRRNHAKSEVRETSYQSATAPLRDGFDLAHYIAIRRTENAPRTVYSPMLHTEAGLVLRERQERFYRPAKPLYEELIGTEKSPLWGIGGNVWYEPFDPSNYIWAMQYGKRWSQREFADELIRKRGLHIYCMYDVMLGWLDGANTPTEHGATLSSPFWVTDEAGREWAFPYSPVARKKLAQQVRELLEKYPGQIWSFNLGDEILYRIAPFVLPRLNDPNLRESSADIQEAVRAIKEDFGCGKFGPPSGLDVRDEPFQFLAFHKYLLNQFRLMMRDLRVVLDEHERKTGHKVYLAPSNPFGYLPNEECSRWGDDADYLTVQTGPSGDPERQSIAFATQLVRDISGKPVTAGIHLESYLGYYSPEEVCLGMSEAARGGAARISFFPLDTRGNVAKSGGTRFCHYGHKARWDAILDYMEMFRTMNTLKFPEPSFGVFFSTDTELSQRTYDMLPMELVYNFTGSGAGAYFKFFDDDQIEDGKVNLQKWPLVIVPDAPLERSLVTKAFQDYVEQGGTLLCFDAKAFSHDINGDDTTGLREALFGAASRPRPAGNAAILLDKGEPLFAGVPSERLPVFDSPYHHYLEPAEGTRVIGRFADGTAAVTCKEFAGGGRAILLGIDLKSLQNLPSLKPWSAFFHALFVNMNIPVDQAIWQFCFPMPKDLGEKPEVPTMKCLTGNNFFWFDNVPQKLGNVSLAGANYTVSRPADFDEATSFSFAEGRLTNRLSALEHPDLCNGENRSLTEQGKLTLSMFADSWSSPEPVEVKFDFGKEVTVRQVKLYFSDTLPAFTLSGDGGKGTFSCEGVETAPFPQELVKLFEKKQPDAPTKNWWMSLWDCHAEVAEKVVDLPAPMRTRQLLFQFGPRVKGKRLILSEIEVWGEE